MKSIANRCFRAFVMSALLAGCSPIEQQDPYFGLSKSSWEGLSPEQQNRVMDEYYKKQAKEEDHQQRLEAQREKNKPYETGLGLIESLAGKKSSNKGLKITEISSGFHAKTIRLENGDSFEISPFGMQSVQHWSRGQRVNISKGSDLLYPVELKNLSNGDSIAAKRTR